MKLVSYKATPGLEHYLESERFRVWRATHKRLLQEDPQYRRIRNRYIASIISLVIASVACGVLGLGLGQIFFVFFAGFVITPAIVWLAFKQQNFMNEEIGRALQRTN